jgi:translocation protein SEC62
MTLSIFHHIICGSDILLCCRKGVYYLSIAAAGFLIFIIALVAIRLVVFCVLWALTFGKHHFWLFPNLTEDVGFLASFWPIYQVSHHRELH